MAESPVGNTPVKKWVKFEEEDKNQENKEDTEPVETPKRQNVARVESPVESTPKKWVKFEEDKQGDQKRDIDIKDTPLKENGPSMEEQQAAAVIPTESVEIKPERMNRSFTKNETVVDVDLHESNGTTINTSNIRQGFSNGDVIVTLLPVNTKFPWITPAHFRPELVPEELMAQGLTLTVEDYVHIMEILTNDMRFTMYNICYKRVLVVWIFTAFVVLLGLLFSGLAGLLLFGLGILWLVFNAAAIFLCMWIKIKLSHNLEKCMANVNKHLLKHKIILGLDDRGRISCHKVNLCFIYFDTTECVKKLQEVIEREEAAGRILNREESSDQKRKREQFVNKMDIEDHDIIIQGSHTTRLSRKQERASLLLLRYSSRWARLLVRRGLTLGEGGSAPVGIHGPRHSLQSACPCQFIENHLTYKPRDGWWSGVYSDRFVQMPYML